MEIIIDKLDLIDDIKYLIKQYFKCEVCGRIGALRRIGDKWVCERCRSYWITHYAALCRELGLNIGPWLHMNRIRLLPGLIQMHSSYPREVYNHSAHVSLCRELFDQFVYVISQKLNKYLSWFTCWGWVVHYWPDFRDYPGDDRKLRLAVVALLFEACSPLLFDQTPIMFRHLIQ
jgi:hypothetical protein